LDTYNDREIFIAPSGLVAAAYARTDSVAETWFAPAGMNRGDLNILAVGAVYNQGDRDALTDAQINSIRVIPGSGYKIWGADTMQAKASALSNVNVRRLLNFVKKSIAVASQYSVYEQHDIVLRAMLKDICDRFLKPIKSGRGLYSFYVQCDELNNPPEIVASGDLNLDVFLDPVIPAKRIHLNAIVTKTGANFKEIALARNGG
jgi:phage tail sheath protein FI